MMNESYFIGMECVSCDVPLESSNTSPASLAQHLCIDCEHDEANRKVK